MNETRSLFTLSKKNVIFMLVIGIQGVQII